MPDSKFTKLNIREDRPTALSSSMQGSNINAIGFNINFLALRKPKLAIEILRLYDEANNVQINYPKAPDEDLELYTDALAKMKIENPDDNL